MKGSSLAASVVVLMVITTAGHDASPFLAASIKRNTSGLPYSQSAERPDGLALITERLRDVILFAFGLYDFQLTGDPAWLSRDRFDISARAESPLSLEQKRARRPRGHRRDEPHRSVRRGSALET